MGRTTFLYDRGWLPVFFCGLFHGRSLGLVEASVQGAKGAIPLFSAPAALFLSATVKRKMWPFGGSKDRLSELLLAKYEGAVQDKHDITVKLKMTQRDLKDANDRLMVARNKRNIRGALELTAECVESKGGVRVVLSSLADDAAFKSTLTEIANKMNIRECDWKRCLEDLYHTYTRDMHGSEENVYIRYSDITSPGERIVLGAIFEHFSIPYKVVADDGTEFVTSPFQLE